MITRQEILMGRDKIALLNEELESNLEDLLNKVNVIRKAYGKFLIVSSGYRPPVINKNVKGASKRSAHMVCQAVDFRDPKGEFAVWCINNQDLLKKNGLYLEDLRWTMRKGKDGVYSGWVHLQTRKASKLIFIPYSDWKKFPMTAPDFYKDNSIEIL